MAELSPYLVIAWILITLILFTRLDRAWAVIVSCLAGTLFLPEVQWSPIPPNNVLLIRFPPFDFTKINCISYGILLGWIIFDHARWQHVRWNRWDIPAVILGVMPAISCLLVGQSAQEAFKALRFSALQWTIPYFIGRVYLSDALGCRRAMLALVVGALIYVPLCLLEIRISPQLHFRVFGFQQHSFMQVMRFGGYRPMVFMQHGLAVALFMSLAAVTATWLWRSGAWPTLNDSRIAYRFRFLLVLALVATALLCKSIGAIALTAMGLSVLFLSNTIRMRILFLLMIAIMPTYVIARAGGWVKADDIITRVGNRLEAERAESFEFRLVNEDKFMTALGDKYWTGMGNDPVKRPKDHNMAPLIIDGQWMMEYFTGGIIALVALGAFFLTPALRFIWAHSPDSWSAAPIAPAAAAAMVCVVLVIDCIPNAMLNPFYMLVVAALNGWSNGIADLKRGVQPVTS